MIDAAPAHARATPPAVAGIPDRAWLAAAVLLFMLAAGNAYRIWWSALVPTLLLVPLILVSIPPQRIVAWNVPGRALGFLGAFFVLALAGLASTLLVFPAREAMLHWLSAYLSPVLIAMALLMTRFDATSTRSLCVAMTLGAMVPLGFGLAVYLVEWGVPSGLELLMSRYDLERMAGYMRATFGNTGNTAAYLTLLLPGWLALASEARLSGRWRWLFATAALVGIAHVLIVQSRTLFLVLAVMVPAVFFYFRHRVLVALAAVAGLALLMVLPVIGAIDEFVELTVGAVGGAVSGEVEDASLADRFEAMAFAWRTILDHPAFGVGPTRTMLVNPHTSAHQFWLQQGSELGVAGLLAAFALTVAVLLLFARSVVRRRGSATDDLRFVLLLGPAAFVIYGSIANTAMASTVVNSWVGLLAAQLALSVAMSEGREARTHASRETGSARGTS